MALDWVTFALASFDLAVTTSVQVILGRAGGLEFLANHRFCSPVMAIELVIVSPRDCCFSSFPVEVGGGGGGFVEMWQYSS